MAVVTVERNLPSPEGRALGEQIARFADAIEQRWRKELGWVPSRCSSCAFRKGTFPNGCLPTQADVTKCLLEDKAFFCHQLPKDGSPMRLCGGFMLLRHRASKVPTPWAFSHEDDK